MNIVMLIFCRPQDSLSSFPDFEIGVHLQKLTMSEASILRGQNFTNHNSTKLLIFR